MNRDTSSSKPNTIPMTDPRFVASRNAILRGPAPMTTLITSQCYPHGVDDESAFAVASNKPFRQTARRPKRVYLPPYRPPQTLTAESHNGPFSGGTLLHPNNPSWWLRNAPALVPTMPTPSLPRHQHYRNYPHFCYNDTLVTPPYPLPLAYALNPLFPSNPTATTPYPRQFPKQPPTKKAAKSRKAALLPWTADEDDLIRRHVQRHGLKGWTLLAKERMPGRRGKQCRERWINQLDPDIDRTGWRFPEDLFLLQGLTRWGPKWALIAKQLPGRPENNAKNRFNAYLHPKIEKYLARKWNHPDFCLLPNQNGCYDFVEDLAAMLKDVRAGKCDAASHFKPVANPTSPLHKPPLQSLGSVLEQTRVNNDSASLTCAVPAEAE
jgi:hypothetical protein